MRRAAAFAALFLLAAWLRLQGLDWDQGSHLHPDERFLTMVGTAIDWPASLSEYFDTASSPLNPANRGHEFFVYGTLPLFLVRAVAGLLGLGDYGHLHLVGRAISAVFDLGTLAVVVWITVSAFGARAALVAGALYAFAVSPIQQAHFFTVDAPGTFFLTLALAFLLRIGRGAGLGAHVAFGVAFGCALACRVNLALLAPLYPLVALVGVERRVRSWLRVFFRGLAGAAAAALTWRILQPYAFAGPDFFDLALAPAFLSSLRQIEGFATGAVDFPPGVQWIGRTPVLFPARNLLVWGLGPALGAVAVVALLAGLVRRGFAAARDARAPRWVALFAIVPFAYHAPQFVATGRYFLPIVPPLAVLAGAWLAARSSRAGRAAAALVLALTALWAFAFTSIYRRPHSRVEASRWIYDNVPPGAAIANEHWDDGLPLPVDGRDPRIYRRDELPLYHDDTPRKREEIVERLVAADWLVLSSNRLHRSIPRTPWRYPLGRRYYELLFAGELGFRLETVVTSYPRLGPLEIPDDGAEEAFTVYDHPKVLIFRKSDAFSRERVERLLGSVPLDGIVRVTPREAGALYRRWQPTDVPLPDEGAVRSPVPGAEIGSVEALARWLAGLSVVTAAAFVLGGTIFRGLPDRGLGFAHVVAWLLPGFGAWWLGSIGFPANAPATVRGVVAVLLLAAIVEAVRRRGEIRKAVVERRRELAIVETVFLGAFALFAGLRALNPAIHWGERPMDFAILNATLRSRSMPPVDPWWAGDTLNYYYFGHELVAAFATLVGVPATFAFNLAIATVGGLVALAAYLAGRRFGGIGGGLAAAAAAALFGNLEGVRLWLADPARRFDFDYFWATTRLWKNSINEFPFWNLVFADLHSHVLAQPLSLAALALGTLWIADRDGRRPAPRLVPFVLVAWVGGAVAVTSSWSAPAVFAVQLAFLLTDAVHGPRPAAAIVRAVALWVGLLVAAWLLYLPHWSAYRAPPLGWGFETEQAPLGAVLRYFGALWFLLVPALAAAAARRLGGRDGAIAIAAGAVVVLPLAILRSPASGAFAAVALLGLVVWARSEGPETKGPAALAFVAGAIGVGTEIVTIADRMNTVFKFYLEAWLLFAVAAGAVATRTLRELSGAPRAAYAAGAVAVTVGALFTAATGAAGFVRFPFAPSPIPTLDGWAHLARMRPGELALYRWIRREVAGVPVVLEAVGPSYQDYGRISMNTGLPTVAGWEWHLVQQGRRRELVDQRRQDVETIYQTTDVALAEEMLRRYEVDLVIVGPTERRTYPTAGLDKFAAMKSLDLVFREQDVALYARPGAIEGARTWVRTARLAEERWRPPPGRLREARDAARAPDGTIVVADFGHRRVQRFDEDLQPLVAFGTEGSGPGEFRDPCGIAVAADGRLLVADTWNHRLQVLAPDGAVLGEWLADLYGPRGVAIAESGDVYVSDTGHRSIVRLSASGEVRGRFGADVLEGPIGIAFQAGELFVADAGTRRIVVFDADGGLLRSWPIAGLVPGGILEPYLEVSPDGVVWVTDPPGGRVLLYDRTGAFVGTAHPERALVLPLGIALVGPDRAVVVDAGADALVRVELPATAKTVVSPEASATGKRSSRAANLSSPAAE